MINPDFCFPPGVFTKNSEQPFPKAQLPEPGPASGKPLMILPASVKPVVQEAPKVVSEAPKAKKPLSSWSKYINDVDSEKYASLRIDQDSITLCRMSQMTFQVSCLASVKFDRIGLCLLASAIIHREAQIIMGLQSRIPCLCLTLGFPIPRHKKSLAISD